MPNFKTHALIGGGVAFAAYCLKHNLDKARNSKREFDLGTAATWAAVGAIAASIPDWLEPATSPNHRGFFHSIAVLFLVLRTLLLACTGGIAIPVLLLVAGLAYVSHLIADACTPRCLPWI